MKIKFRAIPVLGVLLSLILLTSSVGYAIISVPGAVPASGCREGSLMSTDAFTTTGFSQVRTVNPGEQAPAGSWVIADAIVPTTGVSGTPNCPLGPPGSDGLALRIIGLKLTPTISSWQAADIQKVELIQDNNCDALYDPGIDFVMQSRSGSELQTTGAINFVNGPASPLFLVGPAFAPPMVCAPMAGAVGILAVVTIGPNPQSGVQFGLSMEALAADVPGLGAAGFSSGLSNSQNKVGSSIRLQIIGGGGGGPLPGPPPPTPGGSLAGYDLNSNCTLDDSEFFRVLDDWLGNSASDDMFFDAVDAWINQTGICAVSASAVEGLSLDSIVLSQSSNHIALRALGNRIDSSTIEVFGLNGQSIYQAESVGSSLRWNMRTTEGQALSNGVYLYRVTVRSHDGAVLSSDIKKLVLVR